jgi:hypothetical protein
MMMPWYSSWQDMSHLYLWIFFLTCSQVGSNAPLRRRPPPIEAASFNLDNSADQRTMPHFLNIDISTGFHLSFASFDDSRTLVDPPVLLVVDNVAVDVKDDQVQVAKADPVEDGSVSIVGPVPQQPDKPFDNDREASRQCWVESTPLYIGEASSSSVEPSFSKDNSSVSNVARNALSCDKVPVFDISLLISTSFFKDASRDQGQESELWTAATSEPSKSKVEAPISSVEQTLSISGVDGPQLLESSLEGIDLSILSLISWSGNTKESQVPTQSTLRLDSVDGPQILDSSLEGIEGVSIASWVDDTQGD